MTDLSLIINGFVLGCGIAVGFSLGLLRAYWKQRERAVQYNPWTITGKE